MLLGQFQDVNTPAYERETYKRIEQYTTRSKKYCQDKLWCWFEKAWTEIYLEDFNAFNVPNTLDLRSMHLWNTDMHGTQINATHIFCLTRGPSPTHSWRNGDARCCQLSNIADPLVTFLPSKKCPNLTFFSPSKKQSLRIAGTATWAQVLAPLTLSLCVSSVQRAAGSWRAAFSVKHR